MPRKNNFTEQVVQNESTEKRREENTVKSFSEKGLKKGKKLKRTCVLVDPETWEEFKNCTQRYGITASAQINIFINKFIMDEKKRIKEENDMQNE